MNYQKLLIYSTILLFCYFQCCASQSYKQYIEVEESTNDDEWYASIEEEILRMLGFPEAPKNPTKPLIKKRSASDYMVQIYNQKSEPTKMVNITEVNRQMAAKSDVIISFMAEQPHSEDKPERVRRMWFNTDGVAKDNKFLYGELRLFRSIEGIKKKYRGAFKIVVDRVYYDVFHQKYHDEVDSVMVPANYEGWIQLNVTRALHYWMQHPRDNRGVRVLTFPDNQKGKRTRAENIGIVGFDGPDEKQPFLTGYYKNKHNNKIKMSSKDVRQMQKNRVRRSAELQADNSTENKIKFDPPEPIYKGECKRHNYYVNFKDIKWHEWILAPQGYDMYYCDGTCQFPLATHDDASNYAVAISLYYMAHPDRVPQPCCVPANYSPIKLLYYENENRVVFKMYTSMVVNSCGCR